LIDIVQKPEVPDPRILGNRHQWVADEHERQLSPAGARVAFEELEQLPAALVLVDTADIHGERLTDAEFVPEAAGLRALWDIGSDAHDDTGHIVVARGRFDHRALLVGVVHDGAHAAEDWLKYPQADRLIALGR